MTVLAVNGTIDPQQYVAVVERTEELARLQVQAQRRKSMLILGSEAVGKTRLLRAFVQTQPPVLFVPNVQSPHEMLLALIEELRRVARPGITLPANCTSLRTGSLKGLPQRALEKHPFFLALDHLVGPLRVVTCLIKDLNYFDRTPVIFVARTPHMEDIGNLQPMCTGKAERLELKEFMPPIALEFAGERRAVRDCGPQTSIMSCTNWLNGAAEIRAASSTC